jgi:NADH-quinone oxidoreductase subunit M
MAYYLLLQAVIIPLIASPFAYWIGRRFGSRATIWFSFLVLLYSTFALLLAANTSNPVSEYFSLFPASVTGSQLLSSIGNFGFYLDGISIPFALTIYIICTAVALYSFPYMKHRILEQEEEQARERRKLEIAVTAPSGTSVSAIETSAGVAISSGDGMENLPTHAAETTQSTLTDVPTQEEGETARVRSRFGLYTALLLLYSAGMVGTVLATNLIELYFFFEFMLVPSYFLIAEFGYGARGRISMMYLLWTHIGALLMLLAFLAIGSQSGNFVFLGTGAMSDLHIASILLPFIVFGIIVGLFVKLAAFGLHIWLPYAHGEAPTPISALLSPAMIGIGGYIIIRIFTLLLPSAYAQISLGVAVWGIITMFYGGIMALAQDDIKRLFAYSSVSQMGYIIFGIATASSLGVSGSVFQFVSHGTAKAILFMVAGLIIVQAGGLRSIKNMGGLSVKLPVTAVCAAIGFLGLLGFPETNGFQSEWLIFSGGFNVARLGGAYSNYWLVLSALAVIATLVTASYALWTMKRVFFGKLPDSLSSVREGSVYMLAPLLFLAALTILLGVFPQLVDGPLFQTIQHLPIPLR